MRLADAAHGSVRLTGRWSGPERGAVLVVVHGLGGCAESFYARRAAAAAHRAGLACLRLNLRGADESGEDIYHAGLTRDLEAALASAELAGYERLFVLGYSLGGHLGLRLATETPGPRLAAVAAVCAPLDLAGTSRAFDLPARWLYRRYLFGELRRCYAPVARRGRGPIPLEQARAIRHIREWDDRIVAPRFGFADASDYYRRMSAGRRLVGLTRPALLVAARHDPFVPAHTVAAWVDPPPPRLTVVWAERAGHVGFPADLDLGEAGAPFGLEGQAIAWLLRQRR